MPTNKLIGTLAIDTGSSVNLVSAALSSGEGDYLITFINEALKVNINPEMPLMEASANYTSTITWSMITGP
jgi:hypothetical protein